jgi:hypothetical protein
VEAARLGSASSRSKSAGEAGAGKLGLEPKIIMSGIDADVCKTYVSVGLGIDPGDDGV